MKPGFPGHFSELEVWASHAGVTLAEARVRLAQFAILASIASFQPVSRSLVFKGGNALDLARLPNRSTRDLDFSIDHSQTSDAFLVSTNKSALSPIFLAADSLFGVLLAVNSVIIRPPGGSRTRQSIDIRIGYALADEIRLRARMQLGKASNQVVPIEISTNEVICATTDWAVAGPGQTLRVSTFEEIVSEKLRALAQQVSRNRTRPQDVLDIAVIVQTVPDLAMGDIASFLIRKAEIRDITISRQTFSDEQLWQRARVGYDALQSTVRTVFIPFEEARLIVLALVAKLNLPE